MSQRREAPSYCYEARNWGSDLLVFSLTVAALIVAVLMSV